jgi:RHS repeat-associated protein
MRLVRVLLVWACVLPLLPAHGAGRYRVTLATGGGDPAAVAKRLAAAYHAQLETPVDESGTFELTLSAATADLLARDPLVARLEAPAVAPDAATTWNLGTYEYDHAGNIRKIGTRTFVYDGESRLSYETVGAQRQQELTYDGFGNIRSITEGSKQQTVGANKASNRADVSSVAQNHMSGTYDGAGNMITAVSTTDTATPRTYTFTYDALNVVTKSTTDASRAYVYNVSDERIGVITLNAPNGTETSSQWTIRDPGGQVLRRFSRQAGQWRWMQDYIYRDGKMLASESNDQIKTLHYHLDHLGSPRLITGNGGAEVARHTYYPFGEEAPGPTPQVAEPKTFTGHERDGGGLDYMHARYYDYIMGRFLSVDKAPGSRRRPQSWNRYAYSLNNPINMVDKNGLWPTHVRHTHQNSIDRALPFLSERDRMILRHQQVVVDREQSTAASFKHAMRGTGESAAQARADANTWISSSITDARRLEAHGQHAMAMVRLGDAIHTMQDATSPSHVGFQEWNDAWGTIDWRVTKHITGEFYDPGQMSTLDEATRNAWKYFTGAKPMPNDFFEEEDHNPDDDQNRSRYCWVCPRTIFGIPVP